MHDRENLLPNLQTLLNVVLFHDGAIHGKRFVGRHIQDPTDPAICTRRQSLERAVVKPINGGQCLVQKSGLRLHPGKP